MRHSQYEMFCGVNIVQYFPSKAVKNMELLTDQPACVLNKIPFKSKGLVNPSILLQLPGACWILPAEQFSVTIYIMLRVPAVIKEISLRIPEYPMSAGHSDCQYVVPNAISMEVGPHLNNLHPVFNVCPFSSVRPASISPFFCRSLPFRNLVRETC